MHKLLQFLAISMAVQSILLTGSDAAAQCNPVAYLFRHGEESNEKHKAFDNTLTDAGKAHAKLYIEMTNNFQRENPQYCPIKAVYALNPENYDGSIGTSNPYWTADPLAQATQAGLPRSTSGGQDAIINVQGMKLTEYLKYGESGKLVDDIKSRLNNQQSVAIFWSSQGMCTVAKALGPTIPYTCGDTGTKPPRNSVFLLNYAPSSKQFTGVTLKYLECFNYDATSDSFSDSQYYCQFSYSLNDWENPQHPGFSANLRKISGRICDKDNPGPCKP